MAFHAPTPKAHPPTMVPVLGGDDVLTGDGGWRSRSQVDASWISRNACPIISATSAPLGVTCCTAEASVTFMVCASYSRNCDAISGSGFTRDLAAGLDALTIQPISCHDRCGSTDRHAVGRRAEVQ
jgi:hypothetical protein